MMVHHLPTAQKQTLFAEERRVLSQVGSFFLLDFNAPATEWQAAIARTVTRFEQIDDNLYGRLPAMLRTTGFDQVDVIWQVDAFLGREMPCPFVQRESSSYKFCSPSALIDQK